jgi:hypothetical protein
MRAGVLDLAIRKGRSGQRARSGTSGEKPDMTSVASGLKATSCSPSSAWISRPAFSRDEATAACGPECEVG